MSLKISIEEYSPGEENEPLIITGSIDGDRSRYNTLKGDFPILNYAGGLLKIDEIKGVQSPISSFEFSLDSWTYPDPSIDPERPLEESIYGQQASVYEGLNGTYFETQAEWNDYLQWYNWSVETSERVRGYDCGRLNITSDFFGFMYLSKLIWLSNDVPAPVKLSYVSITRWNEPNETGHIILSTNQTLEKDGYLKGGNIINVNPDAQEPFVDRPPSGTYDSWEMGP